MAGDTGARAATLRRALAAAGAAGRAGRCVGGVRTVLAPMTVRPAKVVLPPLRPLAAGEPTSKARIILMRAFI